MDTRRELGKVLQYLMPNSAVSSPKGAVKFGDFRPVPPRTSQVYGLHLGSSDLQCAAQVLIPECWLQDMVYEANSTQPPETVTPT